MSFSKAKIVSVAPPHEHAVDVRELAGVRSFISIERDEREARNEMGEVVAVAYYNERTVERPIAAHPAFASFREQWHDANPGCNPHELPSEENEKNCTVCGRPMQAGAEGTVHEGCNGFYH